MSRVALVLVLLLWAQVASAADLPPGALARLGDDRFRAGDKVQHLAISPDGKQIATTRRLDLTTLSLAVWDADTGHIVREQGVNSELFKGLVWSPGGASAIVIRADPQPKDKPAKGFPDDFRVWDFTNPKAEAPPLFPPPSNQHGGARIDVEWPRAGAKYSDFVFSADGKRVAARWESGNKYAVHVFELKPTDTAAKLTRVGTIDLGAEGADEVHVSTDGNTVVTFRGLENSGEATATMWNVATGKPAKPVRVPWAHALMVSPDARSFVYLFQGAGEWGLDRYDTFTAKPRQLTRREYDRQRSGRPLSGAFAFTSSGDGLAIVIDDHVSVLDLTAAKERGRLEGHTSAPVAIAVSADGTRIATADEYGLIRVWDAKTFRPLNEAPGHRAPVKYAELSPDGKRLLTWAPDETVRLWDVATGKELRAFAGAVGGYHTPTRGEASATFTPDGTVVLFSTSDGLIARDLQTGLEVPLPGDMKKLESRNAVFSPDGKSVLTCVFGGDFRNETCAVWEWPSGKKRIAWEPERTSGPFCPGFSPDGSVIFEHPTSPKRYDAKTGKELPPAWKDYRVTYTLNALRPNPGWFQHWRADKDDNPRIAEAGTDKTLTRFRFAEVDNGIRRASRPDAISPRGGQYASWRWEQPDEVCLCESATHTIRRVFTGYRGAVRVLGFTPDGSKLLTAGGDHTVLVWDMRLQHVPLPDAVKKETSAAKLWDTLATGTAKDAYLAMARLAREPDAALKMAKMKLKPATKEDRGTDAANLADARAVELLEALDTDESRALLKELAGGHADAFRTQEAKRALERKEKK